MAFVSTVWFRLAVAISGGVIWALAFPLAEIAGLAWVAPAVLLLSAAGCGARRAFLLGYTAGFVKSLLSLYWLLYIPFPAGAVVGWLALSAYLALYPALWVALTWLALPRHRPIPSASPGAPGPAATSVERLRDLPWNRRALWILFSAALWVALDMVLSRLFGGFPWNLLGSSQFRMLPVIQIASITGIHGVTFLIVWFSVAGAVVFLRLLRPPENRWSWIADLRLPLVAVLAVVWFGVGRLLDRPRPGRELQVALVQPSIPQRVIWDAREDGPRFRRIMELSEQAAATRPDLLVWPEASLPGFSEENYRAVTNLIARHRLWMVFGADDAEVAPGGRSEDAAAYNAAFLFGPEGRYRARYRKQQLVAFGEFLPGARWLPFLRDLLPIPGDFTPGSGPVPFEVGSPPSQAAVLICFEDVFPHLVRRQVRDETDFLLNLTNNGWFGESAAQWQHAAAAVFRAVETRRPLVRSTNNGLTCWIDERGALRDFLHADPTGIYGPGFLGFHLPLPPPGERPPPTLYLRYGDWLGWACLLGCLPAFAALFRRSRRAPPAAPAIPV